MKAKIEDRLAVACGSSHNTGAGGVDSVYYATGFIPLDSIISEKRKDQIFNRRMRSLGYKVFSKHIW